MLSRLDLVKAYKAAADEVGNRVQNTVAIKLKEGILRFDMDSLMTEMEAGMNRFIQVCPQLKQIAAWSSLTRIEDVDELLASNRQEDANLLHSSVLSFYQRVSKFKQENPNPPTSSNVRGLQLLSLDCYFNERLIRAIGQNLAKSTQLNELTLIGVHFSPAALGILNDGLLKSASLRKLRMNYCFSRPELLMKIFPALS